jgi:Ca2+-binding RTX toxin-like protein
LRTLRPKGRNTRRKTRSLSWLPAAALIGCATLAPTADAAQGDISTVAGTSSGFSGDGGPAIAAQLQSPTGVVPTRDGGFLIADSSNHRVRRVSPSGIITTIAGTGTQGLSGDNGPATSADLNFPLSLAPTPDGGFLFVDGGNYRIRKVDAAGTITTVAGTTPGYSGDNGPATAAQLMGPTGVAPTPDGGFLVADAFGNRIRRVSPAGIITTAAGDGTAAFGGDNGPATAAQLDRSSGVAPTPDGGFLIADRNNHRIRKVDAAGIITTVAGDGTAGLAGDNGAATAAQLNQPSGVAVTTDGGYLIADRSNHRIRKVDAAGIISTVAGSMPGISGDGGPATAAQLNTPLTVAPMPDAGFLIADTGNSRIRRVEGAPAPSACGVGPFFVILGQASADALAGTELRDAILAGGGSDSASGLGAADCLLGEGGADKLAGGPDADRLDGGPGNDIESGDAGADALLGGSGADKLTGGAGRDKLAGGASKDRLIGGAGKDKLSGGAGKDKLSGGAGKDKLSGGAGKDKLSGGAGKDKLSGGAGRDRILCGAGKKDTAVAGRGDRVAGSCEKIK